MKRIKYLICPRMKDRTKSNVAGLSTGLINTALFHPSDRALYLHMINKKPLFHIQNWTNLYQGINNSVFSKCMSYGYYFTLLDQCTQVSGTFSPNYPWLQSMITGTMVGGLTTIINNPINVVKYNTWGTNKSLSHIAKQMYVTNGIKSFMRGMTSTFLRDSTFTSIYSYMRMHTKKFVEDSIVPYPYLLEFVLDGNSILVATLIASPLNYSRNMQYRDAMHSVPNIQYILRRLAIDVNTKKGFIHKSKYAMTRLGIGWGTLRVTVGISFGQILYNFIYNQL